MTSELTLKKTRITTALYVKLTELQDSQQRAKPYMSIYGLNCFSRNAVWLGVNKFFGFSTLDIYEIMVFYLD